MQVKGTSLSTLSWQEQAACNDKPTAMFYPNTEQGAYSALKICRGCPVRQPCLDYALETRELYGVWGGTTEDERRKMLGFTRQKNGKLFKAEADEHWDQLQTLLKEGTG